MIASIALWIMGMVLGAAGHYGFVWYKRLRRNLIPLVFLTDGDDGTGTFYRIPGAADKGFKLGKGDTERHYILEGKARHSTNYGSFWIVNKPYGWNLLSPGVEIVQEDRRLQYATICDPWTYAQAEKHNDAQDAMRANDGSEHWLVKVAPIALAALGLAVIGVIIIIVMLGRVGGGIVA